MRVKPKHVLVRLSKADRRSLFEKPILLPDGRSAFMTIEEEAGKNFDKSYSQSVSVGTILAVGSEVTIAKPGDIALLDYIVDHTENFRISNDNGDKLVSISTETKFYKADLIIDANRRTPKPTPVHKKGELEEATLLIAVVRRGTIYPLFPYVFLNHKRAEKKYKQDENSPVWSAEIEESIIEREVLFSHEGSEFKKGDMILCESEHVFERQLHGQEFDVIFEQDIVAVLVK